MTLSPDEDPWAVQADTTPAGTSSPQAAAYDRLLEQKRLELLERSRRRRLLLPAWMIVIVIILSAGGGVAGGWFMNRQAETDAVKPIVLGPDDVNEFNIKDDSVTQPKLADSAVAADKIAPGAVGTDQLGRGAVSEDNLQSEAVTSAKIARETITAQDIKQRSIDGSRLKSNAIDDPSLLATGVVTRNKLAPDARFTQRPDAYGVRQASFRGASGTVECSGRATAVGGGGEARGGASIVGSVPVLADGAVRGWRLTVSRQTGGVVYVVCVTQAAD